jgi:putative transposase
MKPPKGMDDPRLAKALCRYEVISQYLAQKPKRGVKKKLLEKLSKKQWPGPDGTFFTASAETIRAWARRYRRSGLSGLMDKERPKRGVTVLTEEQQNIICGLKEDVHGRSLERIISIAEKTNLMEKGVLRRSTVHRVLQSRGLSKRRCRVPDMEDLDRFEADYPNDLWQSDMLVGPWLPNPDSPGKVRRAKLFLFIDDHSRMILHGRFSFDEGLPYMELVFRRAVQKYGVPVRVYFDNGKVYRANHIKHLAAELTFHRIVYTTPHRPEGHGKIEKLNQLVRAAFLDELEASTITTLDELNEAFVAWYERDYNPQVHGATGEPPKGRWEAGIDSIRFVDEEQLRQAFLWTETRTCDKTGIFSLFGVKYQAGPGHGKKRVQIRYDPDALHEVEVWRNGEFVERVKPFSVSAHRRPKVATPPPAPERKPVVDYLRHLTDERKKNSIGEPTPKILAEKAKEKRELEIRRVITLLDDRLEHGVVDSGEVRRFMDKYRPFDLDLAELALDEMLESGVEKDLPVSVYLGAMRDAAKGAMR